MPAIETSRLILRPVDLQDEELFAKLWGDPDVYQGFGKSQPHSAEETLQMLEGMVQHWHEHRFGTFTIRLKESGQFIGYCEMEVFTHKKEKARQKEFETAVELGYALGQEYWGQGYASEAACAVVRFGFEVVRLPVIFGATSEHNLASQRVMLSVGMKPLPKRKYYRNCPNFLIRREEFIPGEGFYHYFE